MRILEHFFPDRELNLVSLRQIVQDINDGKLAGSPSRQGRVSLAEDDVSSNEGEVPQDVEPVVESVNDLHEPLGCMMKDSGGKFRTQFLAPSELH